MEFLQLHRLKSGVSKNATNCVAAVVGGRKWKIPKYKVYYVPQFAKFTEFGCWLIIFWLRSRCYRISMRTNAFVMIMRSKEVL